MTSLLVDVDRGFLLENTKDTTWLLCSNSLREKHIPTHLTSGFILVEYGFQANVNFHEKSQSAWEDSQAICFCAGTASWDWLDFLFHIVNIFSFKSYSLLCMKPFELSRSGRR
jgi:hypothetical protein